MMNELEKMIFYELLGENNDTFLCKLHEEDYFDEEIYHTFMRLCGELTSFYVAHGKTEEYGNITRLLLNRLFYIGALFSFHYSQSDQFQIKNWSQKLEKEVLPDFFERSRQIAATIILD